MSKELIKEVANQAPNTFGVYMMFQKENVIYVGKAKNLHKRLLQYTADNLPYRTKHMVSCVSLVRYTTVMQEFEALILEANLIKKHQPRYNILLKDDKSFPYIKISKNHEFPQLTKYRGKIITSDLYGPFADIASLKKVFSLLQKIFKIRTCSDSYFLNRKRPCIQFEIKRCSAPCTNYITKEEYKESVRQMEIFLKGKNTHLQNILNKQMSIYSQNLEYEKAAMVRDKLLAVKEVQNQSSSAYEKGNCDVIGISIINGTCCVEIFFYRGGQSYGSKKYFFQNLENVSENQILQNFLTLFYSTHIPPEKIMLPNTPVSKHDIEIAFFTLFKKQIKLQITPDNLLVKNANNNAALSLESKLNFTKYHNQFLQDIKNLFGLHFAPSKIELYDNSHIMGEHAVSAMVATTQEGIVKADCRIFVAQPIPNKAKGDDYHLLKVALLKRLESKIPLPNVIIVDGGLGHLNAAKEILKETDIFLVAMSKGKNRNSGQEKFHTLNQRPFTLPKDSSTMLYLQKLRDAVHNLAINAYRKRHNKALFASELDEIKILGKNRKRSLLLHFGSFENLLNADLKSITQVPGIGATLAQRILSSIKKLKKT
ncbi:excinuclease ABC subunit UvrC [Candidatus Sneabacter namystus]|uniref:UvrABC system protein C n=1 Tax=Candidatus Sneabacter namystus TaxID=2601646 RepID=A0A5C0UJC3_9RICK|nr:excinuclease ABC subunit UvrC [Candidatus Sneabacter namystus]QEK39701.1 excinuclease ABC subunit UvrC [Candidatus Sneabacter namystus]